MSIECKHGYLARACDRCEMEQEIERLRAFVAAWDAWQLARKNFRENSAAFSADVDAAYFKTLAAREAVGPCS